VLQKIVAVIVQRYQLIKYFHYGVLYTEYHPSQICAVIDFLFPTITFSATLRVYSLPLPCKVPPLIASFLVYVTREAEIEMARANAIKIARQYVELYYKHLILEMMLCDFSFPQGRHKHVDGASLWDCPLLEISGILLEGYV
jgi:hypothetical protein